MKITKSALNVLKENNLFLKIFLEHGGCKGLNVIFEYTDKILEGFILDCDYILIKESDFKVLRDFQLDYIEEFGYQDFVLTASNDYFICNCGKSFGAKFVYDTKKCVNKPI